MTQRFAERPVSHGTSRPAILVVYPYQMHAFPWGVITGDSRCCCGLEKISRLDESLIRFAAFQPFLSGGLPLFQRLGWTWFPPYLNNLIKRIKRAAFGFRNFANYRNRALLYAGKPNWQLLANITPP